MTSRRPIPYSEAELTFIKENRLLPTREQYRLFQETFNRPDVSEKNLNSLRKRKRWLVVLVSFSLVIYRIRMQSPKGRIKPASRKVPDLRTGNRSDQQGLQWTVTWKRRFQNRMYGVKSM
ncbi:hypothetical protein V5J34_004939 [Endozoicomonas sp. NE35]